MKHFTRNNLDELERRKRANLINSITGYKPANLIGTVSESGTTNLAIFSSCVHLGVNPPLIGFIMRPLGDVERHTYENIKATGVYTINHVHKSFVEKAHWTAAKFEKDVSEFEKCKLTEESIENFAAPFVKESKIKMGMVFLIEESLFFKQYNFHKQKLKLHRTTFDVIEDQFGINESEVIKIMRANMKRLSFEMWRKRVHRRKTEHKAKAEKDMDRFKSAQQRHRDKTY